MRPQDSRGSGRRSGRGPRRSSYPRGDRNDRSDRGASRTARQAPPAKKSFWQKLIGFFKPSPASSNGHDSARSSGSQRSSEAPDRQFSRKPELVEVTSSKLYVGNLSYDATESDLFELFKGVGVVKNAEIVTHKYNEKSKGFGFVLMTSIDEAKRAVVELHDKPFMGRKLVVCGAKSSSQEPNYRG